MILAQLAKIAVRVIATHQVENALAPYGGVVLSTEEVDFLGFQVDYRDDWGRYAPVRNLILSYFDDVYHLHLVGSPDIEPDAFRAIRWLGDFELVGLHVNTLTDEHCRYLGKVKTESLALNSPFITEVGIRFLAENQALKVFSPGNFNLTPEAAISLGSFKQLHGLHLNAANTTSTAFARIPASVRLIALTMPRLADDAYVDTLARWQHMQTLRLIDTEMTTGGLRRMLSLLPPGCEVCFESSTVERMSVVLEKTNGLSDLADAENITIWFDPPD